MTRDEEIKIAADKYCKDEWTHLGFVAGAEWADDRHNIDVRTMAAWQSGYKEAIERACEWLRGRLPLTNLDEFINEFKKAMKGD